MTAVAKLPEISTFIEQMDMLRDDFVKYQDGNKSVPFVVLRDALVAALNAYDDARAALSPAELGGVEKRARELLAAEMREFYPSTADRLVDQGIPAESFPHSTEAAIRAIASALSTPRAAEAVVDDAIRDLAELEPADADHPDTLCVKHSDLLRILVRHFAALTPPSAKGEL